MDLRNMCVWPLGGEREPYLEIKRGDATQQSETERPSCWTWTWTWTWTAVQQRSHSCACVLLILWTLLCTNYLEIVSIICWVYSRGRSKKHFSSGFSLVPIGNVFCECVELLSIWGAIRKRGRARGLGGTLGSLLDYTLNIWPACHSLPRAGFFLWFHKLPREHTLVQTSLQYLKIIKQWWFTVPWKNMFWENRLGRSVFGRMRTLH